jgi:hypothetical protein
MADNQTFDIRVNDLGFYTMRSSVLPSADHVLVSTGVEGKMEWRPYSSGSLPTSWVDISNTSTILGWASYTSKIIRYYVIGKMVVVTYSIAGTSNNILTNFTLPIASSINSAAATDVCFGADNGTQDYITAILSAGSSTINFLYQASLPWTNSGLKIVTGHTIYEID